MQLAPSSAIPNAVGISAITGSANANVLAVIGFSVIYAGQTLPLQWLPALRDVVFLAATIAALAGTVADGTVHWCVRSLAEGLGCALCCSTNRLLMCRGAEELVVHGALRPRCSVAHGA